MLSFQRTLPTSEPGTYRVAVEYAEEVIGLQAFELAEALCGAAWNDSDFDLDDALARLSPLAMRHGPATFLDNARMAPGDLCLILVDQVEEALAHIQELIVRDGEDAPSPMAVG